MNFITIQGEDINLDKVYKITYNCYTKYTPNPVYEIRFYFNKKRQDNNPDFGYYKFKDKNEYEDIVSKLKNKIGVKE